MANAFVLSTTLLELKSAPRFLLHFLKNPIQTMHQLPPWHVSTYMLLQALAGFTTGILLGLFTKSILNLFIAAVVLPVASLLITWIITLYFHYSLALTNRHSAEAKIEATRLFKVVSLATLPYFGLHTVSSFLPPIDLLGFAITSLLIIVGLVENVRITRKSVIQNVAILYVVFFIIWSLTQIQQGKKIDHFQDMNAPLSIEQMENSLSDRK